MKRFFAALALLLVFGTPLAQAAGTGTGTGTGGSGSTTAPAGEVLD